MKPNNYDRINVPKFKEGKEAGYLCSMCVDKAEEKIKTGIIAGIIDDLNEIFQELWDVDIPSPTVPEYREHHEQIQGIMAVVTEKLKKYQEAESEEK